MTAFELELREVRKLNKELAASGKRYCNCCGAVKEQRDFSPRRPAGFRGRCKLCEIEFFQSRKSGGRNAALAWPDGYCSYTAAHKRVSYTHGPARTHQCQMCDSPATGWAYTHTDTETEIVGPRKRGGVVREVRWSPNPGFYMALCTPCHTRFDRSVASDRRKELDEGTQASG